MTDNYRDVRVVIAESYLVRGKAHIWLCFGDMSGHGEFRIDGEFEPDHAHSLARRMFLQCQVSPKFGMTRMFERGWPDG